MEILGMIAIICSCEKIKEQEPINLRTYPRGVKFSAQVYPILSGSCSSCHDTPGDKDFSTSAGSYNTLQVYGLNQLPSQPVSPISDSVKYWTEVSQLLSNSAFHNLINDSHSSRVKYTTAQSDIIYGWIIDGAKNN